MNIISYLCNMKTIKTTVMKKIAFVIISFLCFMHGVWGQDTLFSIMPPSNYLLNQWMIPDTTDKEDDYAARFMRVGGSDAEEDAYSFNAGDSLTIYGIAVSMVTSAQFVKEPERHSLERTFEYLKLYQYHADSMQQVGESFKIHADSTPVTYYYSPDRYLYASLYNPPSVRGRPVFPVYEFMFNTPQTVTDTFFIGHTLLTQCYLPILVIDGDTIPSLGLLVLSISSDHASSWPDKLYAVKDTDEYNVIKWSYMSESCFPRMYYSYYLFPILGPDSTSAGGGSDTTQSIQKNMLERYTHVFPNPATDRVQVLSSFGLTHLEAYDADGRRVAEREASGLEATLDVTAWPRGTYILRITTPVGTVTKKLLVQ